MAKQLMTGNEAIARGVYEAGVRYAAAYPGTPSTEILETIATYKGDVVAEWAPNEKVALEAAYGYSVMGGRAFASMKQVGMNVAADPMFSMAYTGCNGGLVIVTADEPGIHSSQTEQDNRYYGKMAKLPVFEPSDSQECKDMVLEAFSLSEQLKTPVILRMTTRICHSKGIVELGERKLLPACEYKKDIWQYTTMPAVSMKLRGELLTKLEKLEELSCTSRFNFIEWHSKKIGVITNGVSYQYAREAFGESASYLRIGFSYPMPTAKIRDFAAQVETLYVIEETEPFMEEYIKSLGIACIGREKLTQNGELSQGLLRRELLGQQTETLPTDASKLVNRPPMLCAGCPHRAVFYELARRKDIIVSGDIGCYGLGAMPPLNAVDTVLCMGTSVSGGHGMAKAIEAYGMNKRVVSVIGDSTFFHSGMTGLLNNVYNHSNTVTIVLDNRITGMTGHQDHPGTGYTAQGDEAPEADIARISAALGVQHIRSVNPLVMQDMADALQWALSLEAPSVIIARWPCALKKATQKDTAEFGSKHVKCKVITEKCVGCRLCTKCGCPAVRFDKTEKKASIDKVSCLGCTVCMQICKKDAIVIDE